MKQRNSTPIRGPGQRSISSTLLFRTYPPHKCATNDTKEGANVVSDKGRGGSKNVSLTAFLNHKLHTTSVLPVDKVEEERVPMTVKYSKRNESVDKEEHGPKRPWKEIVGVIEDSVFKLFNGSGGEGRKRSAECMTAPSRSEDVQRHSQKHLLVLGDDPKPKRRAFRQVSCSNKIPKPLYNHYENGTGWWDSEREGVDSEEVGNKEIWEGVGSTTLGGLQWN